MRDNQGMAGSISLITFASVMSAAIDQKQVTLTELRGRLAARGHTISLTSLSYWRSGKRVPERQSSVDAIPDLESLLGLEPGTLAKLVVGPSARRVGQVERFDRLLDHPLTDPIAGQSFTSEGDVSRVSTQMTVRVGSQREVLWTRMRRVVVANRDGVEGFTVFQGSDSADDLDAYRFHAVAGCTVHAVEEPARNLRRVELRFPRPLMLGESAITEVEVTQAEGAPLELDTDYRIAAEQRLEEALVWVQFEPDVVPSKCWVHFTERGLKHSWPVDLDGTNSVHYRQRDFGPGTLGIRWEW